jgi:hypothetical protein
MHLKLLVAAGITGLLMLAPVPAAAAACCDQHQMKAGEKCCDMPCCADHADHAVKPASTDILLQLAWEDDPMLANDPQWAPAPPVRQLTEIWFHRPVLVGRHILQGRYVIEHDNDRMARGEPCTHIYAYNDQKNPVVAFHCTHFERDRPGKNTAVVASVGDGTMQQLLEFQFAGETASHGVPSER